MPRFCFSFPAKNRFTNCSSRSCCPALLIFGPLTMTALEKRSPHRRDRLSCYLPLNSRAPFAEALMTAKPASRRVSSNAFSSILRPASASLRSPIMVGTRVFDMKLLQTSMSSNDPLFFSRRRMRASDFSRASTWRRWSSLESSRRDFPPMRNRSAWIPRARLTGSLSRLLGSLL